MSVESGDWTALLPAGAHTDLFKSFEWDRTELGPLTNWCLELRLYILQAFSDTHPICIWWTSSYISIYNEAYVPLTGENRPQSMGIAFSALFPQFKDTLVPVFDEVVSTRKAAFLEEISFTVSRNGFVEETYFNAKFLPLSLRDGTIGGLYNTPEEITWQIMTDRRARMLNKISSTPPQESSAAAYQHIMTCFRLNRNDVPFALLFDVSHEADDGDHDLIIVEALSVPEHLMTSRPCTKLYDKEGFMPYLNAAQSSIIISSFESHLAGLDWDDVEWGGHGQRPTSFATIPLLGAGRIYGFLIIGHNPRRPLDLHCEHFMADLQRHSASAVGVTVTAEETKRRSQLLQDRLEESERQIRYIVQHADVGMMQLTVSGTLLWANEHYHEAIFGEDTGGPRKTFVPEIELSDEDFVTAEKAWQQVLQGQKAQIAELRLRRRYVPPTGASINSTILLSAFPYFESGQVKSVMACLTDVSSLKWAESWQTQLANEAKEAKRQQSEFTDAISHEVRNPLAAILQLADDIASSMNGAMPASYDYKGRLLENVDAAKIILSCAQHQKRIVDDVLTLSRLDFTSMTLSPTAVNLAELVQDSQRITDADAKASSISTQISSELSEDEANLPRFMCDPLRITQVLVNLLNNAIKFTKHEEHRSIIIKYRTTNVPPPQEGYEGTSWAPTKNRNEESTSGTSWGTGARIYLVFSVQDTGLGITPEQISRIFDRFEQANPRTTIKYGGSGLGLFISHALTENHGGGIGCRSNPGSGSTFIFYVKARRVRPNYGRLGSDTHSASSHVRANSNQHEGIQPVADTLLLGTAVISPAVPRGPSSRRTFHILLVEDNLINQKVLRKQLTKAGCTVYVANHGVEALDFIRTSRLYAENHGNGAQIDVVLMDLEMPIMDGLTCTRQIRMLENSGQYTTHIEVIAVTANVRAEQVQVAKEAGVDTLFAKPFIVSDLLEKIALQLNG